MIKKFFIILLLYIIISPSAHSKGYDFNVPLEGDSIVSDSLQFIIVKDIYSQLSKKLPACYDYSITNTQVIHYPYDVKKKKGKYVAGYWKELWSVNACNKIIQIPVTFYIKGKRTQYVFEQEIGS